MTPRASVMEAIEKLNYRVTVGDVAAQAGLNVNIAQGEVLALATATGGHLQVAETGEIAYKFDPSFRTILLNRSLRLQAQAWLQTLWKWLFYLIRISFGILLVVSILIVVLGIVAALMVLNSRDSDNNADRGDDRGSNRGGGGISFSPDFWVGWGNPFAVFTPDYYEPERRIRDEAEQEEMGFLEAVYSFLFGDGNPNRNLEERRFQAIAAVIRNNDGVVTAEQLTPYLDDLGTVAEGYEDYVLPVLMRFNGLPQVSDRGTLVYAFPELQKVAELRQKNIVADYLEETRWQFSKAGTGKITLAVGLGIFYLVAALFLGGLLSDPAFLGVTGFLGFVSGAYGLLLGYAIAFLSVPLGRYLVLQSFVNPQINDRNRKRADRARELLQPSPQLQDKLAFARRFASKQEVLGEDNLAYTTETDLNDQEYQKMLKERDSQ